MHNYVRNDTTKSIQKGSIIAVVKITDIVLDNSLAKLPGSKVFTKLIYAGQEYLSKSKDLTKNPDCREIKLSESRDFLIKVLIKGFIFGTKEVGECAFTLEDSEACQRKNQILFQGTAVGTISLSTYTIKENTTMSTQSTCNSLDMRDEYIKDSSHLELDFFKPMNFFSHFQHKNPDEFSEEETDQSMYDFIEKVSVKKSKILSERKELSSNNKKLEIRSESVRKEKCQLALETAKIKEERKNLQKLIVKLNSEFNELKHDKFKTRAQKKLVGRNKGIMAESLNRLHKQKPYTKPSMRRGKENLDYSILELSESVLPIINNDSPVPDEVPEGL